MKKLFTVLLIGGVILSTAVPTQATAPTQKVSNVVISAVGLQGGQLKVSWTVPSSFDGDFAGYVVILKNSNGIEVQRTDPLVPGTVNSTEFDGLVNGEAYSAEVVTNYDGPDDLVTAGNESATPYAVPDAPAKPTVSRTGSGQILVDWEAPTNNNGNEISGYTIVCNPSCSNSAITSTTTEKTIVGLKTSTSYTVTVAATNERGNSIASISSDAVTPHADVVAPSNLVITPGYGQIAASWSPASISGATVSSYTVQLYLESAPDNFQVSRSVTTANTTFTSLTNGSRYFFKVFTVVGSITSSPAQSLYGTPVAPTPTPTPTPSPSPSQSSSPAPSASSSPSPSPSPSRSAAVVVPLKQTVKKFPTSVKKGKEITLPLKTVQGTKLTYKTTKGCTLSKKLKAKSVKVGSKVTTVNEHIGWQLKGVTKNATCSVTMTAPKTIKLKAFIEIRKVRVL